MRRTNALEDLLGDLTRVFHDEHVPVTFTKEQSYAAIDGSYVAIATNMRGVYGVRVSEAQELRLMVDHLSHEIEHIRESELDAKERFVNEYRDTDPAYARLAGMVVNVLEDVYIDGTRTKRFPGLRGAHAYFVDTQIKRGDDVGGTTPVERRLASGFWQVAHAGYAKGIQKAEPEVRDALAKIRVIAATVRDTDDADERYALAHQAMNVLLDVLPESPDVDELAKGAQRTLGGAPRDPDAADTPHDTEDANLDDFDADADLDGSGDTALLDVDADDTEDGDAGAGSDADAEDAEADEAGGGAGGDAGDGDSSTDAGDAPADGTGDRSDLYDDVADAIEAMDAQADADESGDWWDAGDYEEYASLDDVDERRYADLQQAIDESQTDLAQDQSNRDARADQGVSGDEIRRRVQNSDLVRDLKDALRELTTRDRDVPATSGHSLNIDAVVRHNAGAYGERDLYIHRQRAEAGDRAIAVALDMSGSMSETRALTAVAALAEATEVVGDDFSAIAFQDSRTRLITAPAEGFEYRHLDKVETGGGTPTALGIKDAGGLVAQANKPEKLVVCITDGRANVNLSDGTSTGDADRDVRQVVHALRGRGVKVIGLGVDGATPGYMSELFGEDYVTARMQDLVGALVEIYRRQMNVDGGAGGW